MAASLNKTVLCSNNSTAGYARAYKLNLSVSGDGLPVTVSWALHVTASPNARKWYQCENLDVRIGGVQVYTCGAPGPENVYAEDSPNREWWEQNGGTDTVASGTVSINSESFSVTLVGGFYYWSDTSCEIKDTVTVEGLYDPPIPNLDISFASPDVNTLVVSKTDSRTTDLSDYRYTIKLYTDSSKTQLAGTLTGTSLNDFPITWNQGVPGTTYYYTLDFSGTNSVKGTTVAMNQKSGSTSTIRPSINTTTFTWSASPLYNNHWTPRTIVSYTIGASSDSDSSAGLHFKNYEIQTAINSLASNLKSHRVTQLTGTITLVDLTKWLRECKPRDLVYIKVRVCHVDNANREYFSDWFGMINQGQYIYNKFHLYLTRPATNEALRVNSRTQFNGVSNEKYWNKGEVI